MTSENSYITFDSILKFLSKKINESGNSEINLSELFSTTTHEQQMTGIAEFCKINDDAWISDARMDITKCVQKDILVAGIPLDLEQVFYYLAKNTQNEFWIMFSIMIQRNPSQLNQDRNNSLHYALKNFCNDLAQIDISMTPEEVMKFVDVNKSAIASRFTTKLEPPIQLNVCDQEPFWAHMETIYNLMHPYNKVKFVHNPSHDLVNNIVGKITNISSDDDMGPQKMLTELFSGDLMSQLTSMMQNGGDINQFVQTMISAIPKNN